MVSEASLERMCVSFHVQVSRDCLDFLKWRVCSHAQAKNNMEIFFLTTDNLPFSLWFVSESHTLKVKPFDGALWRKQMCDTFIKTLNFYLNHLNTKKRDTG